MTDGISDHGEKEAFPKTSEGQLGSILKQQRAGGSLRITLHPVQQQMDHFGPKNNPPES